METEPVDPSQQRDLSLALLMNHQLEILAKCEEISKLHEKLAIARKELKDLQAQSEKITNDVLLITRY